MDKNEIEIRTADYRTKGLMIEKVDITGMRMIYSRMDNHHINSYNGSTQIAIPD